MEVGGWLEDSSWLICLGPRGASRKPGPCSRKYVYWCLTSPVLSVRDMGGGVSPELSAGDVGKASGGNAVLSLSPSMRVLSQSPVFWRVGFRVCVCCFCAASYAQVLAGDAVASPELSVGGE